VDGKVYVGEDGAVTEGRVRLALAVDGDGGWEKLRLFIAVAHSSGDGDYSVQIKSNPFIAITIIPPPER
jgi:hypothetical protein